MGEILAAVYDPLVAPLDPMGVRKWRKWAVSGAKGNVLELGVGTGLNLPHYRRADSVTAIDPDGASLRRAFGRHARLSRPITLFQASAERLPFRTSSFDSVLGTLVFCTIPDPEQAMEEAYRVLRPGGRLRLVEHVRVGNRLVSGLQNAATPLWSEISGGCHLNRDTLKSVHQAGFRVQATYRRLGGLIIGIDAIKPGTSMP